MKVKKKKKKGRVHPSNLSTTVVYSYRDPSLVLKQLLPVAILGIALPLPPQDQQVLAYMITRSLNISSSTTADHHQHPKTKTKYSSNDNDSSGSGSGSVVVVVSECGCFDCYTRFWHRWDSSPNRDLIHQVIEAFEDHNLLLLNDIDHIDVDVPNNQKPPSTRKKHYDYCYCTRHQSNKYNGVLLVSQSEVVDQQSQDSRGGREEQGGNQELMEVVSGGGGGGGGGGGSSIISHNHKVKDKGLARKVLPDVVGLFNSRLWTLWSPTI